MPLMPKSPRSMRAAARIGIAFVVVMIVASVIRVRSPTAPPPASPVGPPTAPPTIIVRGIAYWGDTATLRPTTVLRVRLLDLMSDGSTAVVATSTIELARARQSVAWSLRVPVAQRHLADDGWLVVSISDDQQLRYVGTQSARPVAPRPARAEGAGPRAEESNAPAGIRWVRLQSSATGGA